MSRVALLILVRTEGTAGMHMASPRAGACADLYNGLRFPVSIPRHRYPGPSIS